MLGGEGGEKRGEVEGQIKIILEPLVHLDIWPLYEQQNLRIFMYLAEEQSRRVNMKNTQNACINSEARKFPLPLFL